VNSSEYDLTLLPDRSRNNVSYTHYDDGFNAFSHQIPNYPLPQASYNMQPWAHNVQLPQHMYDRYGGYTMPGGGFPNASGSGSPMNYGAYYPPTTYAPSPAYNVGSSASTYRGGYPAAASYPASQSYTSTAASSHNQYAASGAGYPNSGTGYSNPYNNVPYTSGAPPTTSSGTAGGYGNSHIGASGASHNAGHDPTLLTAMHNLSFGSK